MPNLNRLLLHTVNLGADLVPFEINRQLQDMFPGHTVLVTDDYAFDLTGFIQDNRCAAWTMRDLDPLLFAVWKGRDKGTWLEPRQAFCEILWNGCLLNCLTITQDYDQITFLISKDQDVAQRFFEAVCLWHTDSDGRVTVFDGKFRRDVDLEQSIQAASWEDLILPAELKGRLFRDATSFFESKEAYSRYGIPWKRGLLLHGPPGNGKTQATRAMLNQLAKPSLIVRSLREDEETTTPPASRVFRRARQMAPVILLFEDLDTLVSRSNLSSLLNELDGLAQNDGVMSIATTNHIDRLDSALSNRPSRFDRIFEFQNPKQAERLRFLESRFARLDDAMKPSPTAIQSAAKATKGFSGARLQELVGSCAMAWMNSCLQGGMDSILNKEVASLQTRPVIKSKEKET